jgi:hypothetical protein
MTYSPVPTPNCVTESQRAAFMAIVDEFKFLPANQTYTGNGFDITTILTVATYLLPSTNIGFDQEFSLYFIRQTII